jgi:pimeloyl-ACP methyl ester carboxylesterase
LLLPPGSPVKPPVVLQVGGFLAGPRSRSAFNVEQQLFATRGYAVARIDYRGCDGFGRSFLKAGDYQFTAGMVDDLLAGLEYLGSKGLVDDRRVALFTNSWGGVVGIHALARSDRFKLWLNKETVLTVGSLTPASLTFSRKKTEEIESDLGSEISVQKYLASLEPEKLLPQIKIPSFHLYTKTVDVLSAAKSRSAPRDSFIVANYLKKNPGLGEVINLEAESRSLQAEGMEKLLDFLARKMPLN